jgi:hypothetical protein
LAVGCLGLGLISINFSFVWVSCDGTSVMGVLEL